jgi:hypothetical protein
MQLGITNDGQTRFGRLAHIINGHRNGHRSKRSQSSAAPCLTVSRTKQRGLAEKDGHDPQLADLILHRRSLWPDTP